MVTKEQIERIIQLLEHARSRPSMYFGSDKPDDALIFIFGFQAGVCFALGNWWSRFKNHQNAVWIEHGFEHIGSAHPMTVMVRQAMENDAIIQEMFALEIETWQHVLADLDT